MKETIVTTLKQIEQAYHVKILYACEVGSRAWGLASEISDYDVRFIYIHPKKFYLSIDPVGTGKSRDVIDYVVPIPYKLDMVGWEITKSLRLFRKSNPSLLEWLHSPIVYYQAFTSINQMKELLPNIVDQKSCILHYVNMANGNYQKALREKDHNIKTIINIIRPLLAAKWIELYQEFPPLNFQQLVDIFLQKDEIRSNVNMLIDQKINVEHDDRIDYQTLLQYSYHEIESIKNNALSLKSVSINITEQLNEIFRQTLSEIDK